MYYNLNHQSYLIFMKLEFRPYLRTMDLNKDDWRIKIKRDVRTRLHLLRGCLETEMAEMQMDQKIK